MFLASTGADAQRLRIRRLEPSVCASMPNFRPGEVVRVGVTTNEEVLVHPYLHASKAAEKLNESLVDERTRLQHEFAALGQEGSAQELTQLEAELAPLSIESLNAFHTRRDLRGSLDKNKAELAACADAIAQSTERIAEVERSSEAWQREPHRLKPYRG